MYDVSANMKNVGLYKELVENSDSIVIVTDPSFNIRYVSSAVSRSFQVDPLSLVGRNVFEFVNSDRIKEWKQCLQERREFYTEEISLTIPDGRKAYFDVQISNLSGDVAEDGIALHLHEITGRKVKEYELLRANQQLDQVIYKTTHDLKAPLKSALGLVNLADRGTEEERTTYLGMIRKTLMKLDGLIDEMDDFFRNEKLAIQREKIDLEGVIKEELEHLDYFGTNKKIRIDFTCNGEVEFYSDAIRIQTIITNILSNAIKYSDQKKSEPFIGINVSINEEFCQLRIIDNGIGIDQKYLQKIFDLFFRATEHAQGTGLGLFIVKDTIEKLKGTIEVTSTLGQGSTFMISIPNQIHQPALVE
jgi:PAS domain S-box-containing protein